MTLKGSPGNLLPCNLLQPGCDLPTDPCFPETEEEGMGLPRMAGTGGLAWPALYYPTAPPEKLPEVLGLTVAPASPAFEAAASLGFLVLLKTGKAIREHLSVAEVS